MTLPPQALLIRRMEGLVFQTLGEVRASADSPAIGAEYYAGDDSSTALGELDAGFWGNIRPFVSPPSVASRQFGRQQTASNSDSGR